MCLLVLLSAITNQIGTERNLKRGVSFKKRIGVKGTSMRFYSILVVFDDQNHVVVEHMVSWCLVEKVVSK